jgi:ketosteroid isomerase-like protein
VSGNSDTVKAIYDAYVTKDRSAAERLLADNFCFTSPLDNGLDRDSYFARIKTSRKRKQSLG